MATHDDVRNIAAKLPGAIEGDDRFGFSVQVKGKFKGFTWAWMERIHPKKPKTASAEVIAIRVKDLDIKEILLNSNIPGVFTEPHYNGYPAILVRLSEIPLVELEGFLIEGWKSLASKDLLAQLP